MTTHEAATLTLQHYAQAGILTFTCAGPFIFVHTTGPYAVEVGRPDALEIITACYVARLPESLQEVAP